MAGTAVIELEGVLARDAPPNGAPVFTGIQMYHALATQFRLVVDSSHGDVTDIEHWLKVNGLNRHTLILLREPEQDHLEETDLRLEHLNEWKAHGFDIAVWLTSNPAAAARVMGKGTPTLLLLHPQFARPEHRPDYESVIRPWEEVEAEVTRQMALRESVPRIDAEMDYE